MKKSKTVIVGTVTALVVIGIAGYLLYGSGSVPKADRIADAPSGEMAQKEASTSSSADSETTAVEDWKTYTNTRFGFSVQYPKHWQAPRGFGGVNAPGGETYEVAGATAYEWVFTFSPGRIDDFPVIVTVYDLSESSLSFSELRKEVANRMWRNCGGVGWSDCSKEVASRATTVSEDEAVFLTVRATDTDKELSRDFVFIEKANHVFVIEQSGSSSDENFRQFYRSFEVKN